jgi:hypothetical protein
VKHVRHRIVTLGELVSRELAQTRPDSTMTLSVLTGTSLLTFSRLSDNAATAVVRLVRLFV